jgi:hypothetical protein
MPNASNPTLDRKEAQMSLEIRRQRPESGTITESLQEILELLHDLDEHDGKGAPPIESGPAADEPRAAGPEALSTHAVAAPGTLSGGMPATPAPVPAAAPYATRPPHRTAAATLTVVGLVALGAAGLVTAGWPAIPLPVVSAAGKRQARTGGAPEAMARAALPPVRNVAVAKGDVAPEPPAETGHEAPRDADAWRLPPALQVRILLPVIAPDTQDQSAGKMEGYRRTGHAAALPHSGAATAFAQASAVPHGADLTPPGAGPQQPQSARFGRRATPRRMTQASRRSDEFSREDWPARRLSPASAEGADDLPQSLTEPALRGPVPWPIDANPFPALAQQNRAATLPPVGEAGGNGLERPATGRPDYAPAAAERPRRSSDWSWTDRGFPPGPSAPPDEAATGAFSLSPPP